MYKRIQRVVALLAVLNAVELRAATISWTNTSGGLWSAPLNWDAHIVPRSFDSAVITAAGTYTVTVDTNVNLLTLTLGGATGLQTLTNSSQTMTITNSVLVAANGIFNFGGVTLNGGPVTDQGTINWSGGFVTNSVTVAALGVLNLNGAGLALGGALTNTGTIHWSGASSYMTIYNDHHSYSGAIYNQAGALFDIQNDQGVLSADEGFELFLNAGTVRKSAGAGNTTFYVPFTNNGLVDAQSGTIQFQGGGNIGGTYNTASNTTIQFTGGTNTETGMVTNTGAGLFRQYGATVVLNDRITKFFLVSGIVALSPTFEGSGTIQNLQLDGASLIGTNKVTGTLGIDGGALGPAAALTVTATGVLDFNGAAVNINSPLTNAGTVNWSGGSLNVNNNSNTYTGVIYNLPGGFFNLQSDQGLAPGGFGSPEFFSNTGAIRKTAGLGTTTFSLLVTNTGLVDAQSGAIHFTGGGGLGGSYNTASGAAIEFDGGSFTQTGAVTVTGSGVCRENGGTVTLNDQIANLLLDAGNVALSPTFQTNGAIHNLQLDGALLTGTNKVTGTLGIDGGGLASASPLTIATNGVLNFNGAAVNINAPLTNAGTINWSSGSLSVNNNSNTDTGVIYNLPGGLFNLQCDQGLGPGGYGSPEFFVNAGTVRKTAGLGTTTFSLPVTNTGLVDAQSGAIHFTGGGGLGGSYNTASNAAIEFDGGSFTQTGTVTVTGTGVCRENGGTVTLNDQITNLLLVGGNVALSPTFQTNGAIHKLQLDGALLTGTNKVTGTLGIDGGGLGSASPLTVATNGVLNFNGAAVNIYAPLTNAGIINWSSGSLSVNNNSNTYTGVIYNQPGGLFNLQCDQGLAAGGNGSPEFFSNAGTVRKTAGLGTTTFSLLVTNTGLVDAQSGSIHFTGGGGLGGSYNTASGTVIEFDGGSFTKTGTVTVTGTGLCRQNGATVTLNDRIANFVLASGNVALTPAFETNGTIQNLQLDGALLTGTNRVTGTLGIDGGGLFTASPLTVSAGGVLNFNGAPVNINAPLTNAGTINWSSGSISVNNNATANTGVIYNQPGGLFNLQCDQGLAPGGYGAPEFFVNAGTVRKTAGLGSTTINVGFTNTGTLDAQSGTIQISGPFTPTGGTMNFGITSLSYFGKIAFSGNAPFTGTLSANFNGGYFPSAGDSFALVTYTSRTGLFTSLALPSQAQWQTNYSGTTFTLSVQSASSFLPVTLTPVSFAAGKFTLQINGSVGPQYILLASTNLTNWAAILSNTPVATPFNMSDTNAGNFSRRFYRAQLGP